MCDRLCRQDNICYDTSHAFVFIENNCTEVRLGPVLAGLEAAPHVSMCLTHELQQRRASKFQQALGHHSPSLNTHANLDCVCAVTLQPISATATLDTRSYAGDTCVVVEGHALGVAGIIGIAIAAAVVLAILSGVLKCLCCCL